MGAMRVKNVPEDLHEAMRQRAEEEGMTVSDYLLALIQRDLAVPSQRQWLAELSTRTPFNGDDIIKTLDEVRATHCGASKLGENK